MTRERKCLCRTGVPTLLSTHTDKQGVDISFTAFLFVILAKAKEFMFSPALVCVCVCVSVCDHDN